MCLKYSHIYSKRNFQNRLCHRCVNGQMRNKYKKKNGSRDSRDR